jgi:superfamily II DNA or RNA helicase
MRADVYTSETNADTRRQLLARFQTGDIQALLAMRCLDEGVDLPVARRAFIMASSSNPRQFIQRRGRLLRRAPNKDRADIFDFIVIPPSSELPEESFSIERALIRSELRRVIEFASIAENGPAAMARLLDLRREYHLLDVA